MTKRTFGLLLVLVVLFLVCGPRTYAASATNGFGSGWALRSNSVLNTARAIRPRMAFGIWDDLSDWLFGDDKGKNNHDNDGNHDGDGNGNDDHGKPKGHKVGVPEPATLALILVGLAGVGAIRLRRKVS